MLHARQPTKQKPTAKEKPVMSWRYATGRESSLDVAVWANTMTGERGSYVMHSVTFKRSYRDKDGAWKTNDSLRSHELLVLANALTRAYDWIVEQKGEAAPA